MARTKTPSKASGMVVALIFAIVFFGAAVFATIDRMEFVNNSKVTTGTVISTKSKTSSKVDRKFIYTTKNYEVSIIYYKDSKGKEHTIEETPFLSKAPFSVDEKVQVRYDKRDADIGVVDSFVNVYGYLLMFFAIGLVFLLVFIFVLVSWLKDKKRKREQESNVNA